MSSLDEERKILLEALEKRDTLVREEAKNDLYLFNRLVLGVDKGATKVTLAPFHQQLCHFVQEERHKGKLVLVPRLHLKSTLITIGYSLWSIMQNPDIRILILSGKYENAVDFVGAVEDHLRNNERLIQLYGDIAQNPIQWKTDRFTLSVERTRLGEKEPTVLGAGIESNVVSKHFDLIILDDVVARENVDTEDMIVKVIRRYQDSLSLLEPQGQLIVIGTPWTDDDLYAWIQDPDNGQLGQFNMFIRRACEWDGPVAEALKTGVGFLSSLWPQKFDREELWKRYQGLGPYTFSTQYLIDPVPPSEATFKTEWLAYFEEADIKGLTTNNYMTVDPAISVSKEADYTAMVVTSTDRWGNIYVRDIVRARLMPNQIINEMFRLAELYHPRAIGLEDVAWQKTLAYSAKEEMKVRGRYLPIYPVKPGDRSKDERIKGLQPLYANGKIFHNKSHLLTRYLEDELKRFPRGKNDDIIDALSYTLDFFAKPREKRVYKPHYLY